MVARGSSAVTAGPQKLETREMDAWTLEMKTIQMRLVSKVYKWLLLVKEQTNFSKELWRLRWQYATRDIV